MIETPEVEPRSVDASPEVVGGAEPLDAAAFVDEDAFGVLFSYCEVETDEYGQDDPQAFVRRFREFERGALELMRDMGLPDDHHVVCLGHAVYAEFRDSEPGAELLGRVRRAAAQLTARGYVNVTVLSYGSRWVRDGSDPEIAIDGLGPRVVRLSRPSEPLRRALDLETLARLDDAGGGWGPGMYVDVEALEAIGRTPKNAPTVFSAKGADFYRLPPVRLEPR
jgi:hypothetical protein